MISILQKWYLYNMFLVRSLNVFGPAIRNDSLTLCDLDIHLE